MNTELQALLNPSGAAAAERRKSATGLQKRLLNASRLATFGEMAAGIAHELNQPLTAIANYAQASERLLAAPQPNLTEIREALRQITTQAERAGAVIRRVRGLVHSESGHRVVVDVNELIEELAELLESEAAASHIACRLQLATDPPLALVERAQIQEVLLNLFRNAVEAFDAIDGQREILVGTSAASGCIEICVCDTGRGITPAVAARLFDPFFSTKSEGTGLGLPISRTIVTAHGGTLEYRPNIPTGACFVVRLPAALTQSQSA
jgi:two-component system sensor kinase FixL